MAHYHFIGIGGSGLSAIARLLLEAGETVSGCDQVRSPLAEALIEAGARVEDGHSPAHLDGVDVVVRSSAIPDDNPEVQAARAAGIPVRKRQEFLGDWMSDRIGIAVAGTHGKTTTTAMLAWVLTALGQDPSFIVGGVLNDLGVNAHAGKGPHFVIEADEYDRMFLGLRPKIAVVTNVEHDHPDCYPTPVEIMQAFEAFVNLLPSDGLLLACTDDRGSQALLTRAARNGLPAIGYTTAMERTVAAPYWLAGRNLRRNERGGVSFDLDSNLLPDEIISQPVDLLLPGEHNVRNALAVLGVCLHLGLPLDETIAALGRFSGAGRRFEVRAVVNGITLVDDYAHHPTEIRATLQAARQRYPESRIWAVWQPHTYSRTRLLLDEFAAAFDDADLVLVTEIYAAREPKQAFSSAEVVAAMHHPAVHFLPTHAAVVDFLKQGLDRGDVVLVLSAGDGVEITRRLAEELEAA